MSTKYSVPSNPSARSGSTTQRPVRSATYAASMNVIASRAVRSTERGPASAGTSSVLAGPAEDFLSQATIGQVVIGLVPQEEPGVF